MVVEVEIEVGDKLRYKDKALNKTQDMEVVAVLPPLRDGSGVWIVYRITVPAKTIYGGKITDAYNTYQMTSNLSVFEVVVEKFELGKRYKSISEDKYAPEREWEVEWEVVKVMDDNIRVAAIAVEGFGFKAACLYHSSRRSYREVR